MVVKLEVCDYNLDNHFLLIIIFQNNLAMDEPEIRLDKLIEKLRQRRLRLTPQRMAILRFLAASEAHPSAEQVYEHVKAIFPMISLATVYKTIALLKQEGEVLELGFANGSSRYDGMKPYPHPHLICLKCQRIIDPDMGMFSALPIELSQKYGFKIVSHRLDFFGLCPECQSVASQEGGGVQADRIPE